MIRFAQDLRFAARTLRRSPGFTLAVLASLGAGLGLAVAAYSILHSVVLRPLPYPAAERLMVLWQTDADDESFREYASHPDFLDFQREARSFEALAATSFPDLNLRPFTGAPERVSAAAATAGLLPMLGARPALGRLFTVEEDRPNGPRVVVLGHALWQRAFGGDPAIVGRIVQLDGLGYQVVGVLPEELRFRDVEAWLPLHAGTPFVDLRGVHNLMVLGRLRPAVTPAQAQEEMAAIAVRLERRYPDDNAGRGAHVEPLREVVVGRVERELALLAGAGGLLLLIVGANVAGLWLVRAHGRRREIAVRAALGAGLGRLARLLLAEALVVAAASLVLALGLSHAAVRAFLALRPGDLPRGAEVGLDASAVAIAAALALIAAIGCGLAPLARVRAAARARGLGSRDSAATLRPGARAGLVIAEVALAIVLVTGTALLARSLWRLLQVEPGFSPGSVVSFALQLPEGKYPMPGRDVYPDWPQVVAAQQRLLEKVRAVPGVTGVELALNHPLEAGFTSQLAIVGRPAPTGSQEETRIRPVSPGYHQLLGVALRAGRGLLPTDRPGAPAVVLVNQAFVRRYFPGADPLGERVTFWGGELTIVGVVGDERFLGLDRESAPAIYPALAQRPFSFFRLLVASRLPESALVPAVRSAVAALEPDVALAEIAPLTELLARSYAQRRFVMTLLASFGTLALAIAALGIYGLVAFQVAQRRRELGVRQALGAARRDLVRLVAGEGARLTVWGVALGLTGSAALSRLLGSLLFGIEPLDPPALLGAAGLLAVVTLVAAWVPARRAATLDPMAVLREE